MRPPLKPPHPPLLRPLRLTASTLLRRAIPAGLIQRSPRRRNMRTGARTRTTIMVLAPITPTNPDCCSRERPC